MAFFHLKLQPPRPSFPFDATNEENAAMQQHAAYWQAKAQDRVAIVVGPVFDPAGAYGMAVVEVADEAAARALGDNDPVVRAGLGFAYVVAQIPSIIMRA